MRGLLLYLLVLSGSAFFSCQAANISATKPTQASGQATLGSTTLISGDLFLFDTDLNNKTCLADSFLTIKFGIDGSGAQTLRLSQAVATAMYTPGKSFTLGGEYTLINNCDQSLSGNWQLSKSGQVLFNQAFALPPATYCEISVPNLIDLGSFSVDKLSTGFISDKTLTLDGQCTTNFSVTLAGPASGDGNFLLGEDVRLSFSYNNGTSPVINGQPFMPSATQNLNIFLNGQGSKLPAAGQKNASLTIRLDLL